MDINSLSYPNLNSCTLVAEPNISYLSHTKDIPIISEPMSGSTIGLMMLLSTLQYDSSYMRPQYSNAANQAGKAAWSESGGQSFQDKATALASKKGTELAHYIGITDGELAIVGGAYKIAQSKQIDVKGPKIYFMDTHLTAAQGRGSIGVGWHW